MRKTTNKACLAKLLLEFKSTRS